MLGGFCKGTTVGCFCGGLYHYIMYRAQTETQLAASNRWSEARRKEKMVESQKFLAVVSKILKEIEAAKAGRSSMQESRDAELVPEPESTEPPTGSKD